MRNKSHQNCAAFLHSKIWEKFEDTTISQKKTTLKLAWLISI